MTVAAVILAAGFGTRMKSRLPKSLHPLAGRPLIEWSLQAAEGLSDLPPVVVVGHAKEQVQNVLGERVHYCLQKELLGTGHALMQAKELLYQRADHVLVLYSDMPLLRPETLASLTQCLACSTQPQQKPTALSLLTVEREEAQGFGRIVRDKNGAVHKIVEEVDCTPEQLAVRELNPGVYCFNAQWLWQNISLLAPNSNGEYYLTDMVEIAVEQGQPIETFAAAPEETFGINDRSQLAAAAQALRQRINTEHMLSGVTIVDPASTYIDAEVTIGQDSTIYPGTHLQGRTNVGEGCRIGPNSRIVDSAIGDDCRVEYSVIEQAAMERGSEVGPFGHLRPGAHLGEDVHMGNFGEVKNSYLGPGVKMGHFSYIGDATVGENVNIGAGSITCNFDGVSKNRTILGDEVFLGSDTLLVAPVTLGARARTGAGSVVTRDVDEDALVYGVPARRPRPAEQADSCTAAPAQPDTETGEEAAAGQIASQSKKKQE
ncbi:MAG: bifunctional UDP-N-acetylglucosamine diphosphorylase/glucosamine-1-phosphate N-acetyltransferase GlmU [Caldilineaceae bacterium]|nr:bifunctional UDP-N-acetylglucosamine diphosphorylase/glucosamine-1-phosphate N-acetyltransferase GlmU [Caldilineaceae bacterium]